MASISPAAPGMIFGNKARNSSPERKITPEPKIAPNKLPMPPMVTMINKRMLMKMPKGSGLMKVIQ